MGHSPSVAPIRFFDRFVFRPTIQWLQIGLSEKVGPVKWGHYGLATYHDQNLNLDDGRLPYDTGFVFYHVDGH